MKQQLKRVVRKLATLPIIGRFVRIAISIYRFPDLSHQQAVFVTQQLPGLLETISTINRRQVEADGDEAAFAKTVPVTLRQLTLEMAEVRRRLGVSGSLLEAAVSQSIHPSASDVRIQLEPQGAAMDGFLSVCAKPRPGADLVSPLDHLSFGPASVREIHAAHVLDRFTPGALRCHALPSWFGVLSDGGRLHLVCVDSGALVQRHARGESTDEEFRDHIFGAPDGTGHMRHNLLTPELLADELKRAGFEGIELLARGRAGAQGPEFEMVAFKKGAGQR